MSVDADTTFTLKLNYQNIEALREAPTIHRERSMLGEGKLSHLECQLPKSHNTFLIPYQNSFDTHHMATKF